MTKRKKVAVVYGGPGSEREISIASGTSVLGALKKSTSYDPCGILIDRAIDTAMLRGIDTAFLALHGSFGEDGGIQKILEKHRVAYTGSGPAASKLAFDKPKASRILAESGIKMPKFVLLPKNASYEKASRAVSPKMVIKPAREGSSYGISIVRDANDFNAGLKLARKYDAKVMAEEYIAGREFTVGILDDKALPVVEIIPKRAFFDFKAKYDPKYSEEIVPAKIPAVTASKLQHRGLKVYRALKLRHFARIDMIMNNSGQIYVLEANTLPGLTKNSLIPKAAKAAGMPFLEFIETIISLTYETGR